MDQCINTAIGINQSMVGGINQFLTMVMHWQNFWREGASLDLDEYSTIQSISVRKREMFDIALFSIALIFLMKNAILLKQYIHVSILVPTYPKCQSLMNWNWWRGREEHKGHNQIHGWSRRHDLNNSCTAEFSCLPSPTFFILICFYYRGGG